MNLPPSDRYLKAGGQMYPAAAGTAAMSNLSYLRENSPAEIRARLKQAIRSGHPYWLWPDLPHEEWQSALRSISRVAREFLIGSEQPARLAGMAEAIGIAGYTSGMGPLLGSWIEQGLVTGGPAVERALRTHLHNNRIRMDRLTGQAVDVLGNLRREKISATILKGMHTAHRYFREPGERPLSDIDILIDRRDRHRARQVLREMGFILTETTRKMPTQESWRKEGLRKEPRTLSFVHADDPWSIDLQFMLNRQVPAGTSPLELDQLAPLAGRPPWPLAPAKMLSQPSLTLALAVHASMPMINLSLLRIIELILVIRKDFSSGAIGWSEFLDLSRRARALGLIYPALAMCEKLVPALIPLSVLMASRAAAPDKAADFIDGLAPETAQQVIRCSFRERYVWAPTIRAKGVQMLRDIFTPGLPMRQLPDIWHKRVLRLARGTLGR